MPYLIGDVLNWVRYELNDRIVPPATDGAQWKNQELLAHVNRGIATTCDFDNRAAVQNASYQLVPGTKQTLPGDAIALEHVTRNMGTDGETPGRAITTISEEDMTACRPGWHMDLPGKIVRHIIGNPGDPRRYYIWPPSDGTSYVEIQYPQVPDDTQANYTSATATSAAGSTVVTVASTYGIVVGQGIQSVSNYQAIPTPSGTYFTVLASVASIVGNVITLTQPLLQTVNSGDVLSFSDRFPIPDMYATPVFLYVVGFALAKNTARGDLTKYTTFLNDFGRAVGADEQQLDALKIGAVDQ